ncbi:MAG: recombination mediator RecR [Rickettsiaceae bacterium]|nr:recombination mediator RecR [Rickettsiaceae bacterium]
MENINKVENLIYLFSKLPGLGPRSARRIVLHLIDDKHHRMNLLASALQDVNLSIVECDECFNIDVKSPCSICESDARNKEIIAIVETIGDLWALERSKIYNGLFHILGSSLSVAASRKPETLKLHKLEERIDRLKIKELIIATNATLDGQTTAYYITEFFKTKNIVITRLASGIPIGGELDYLDEGTLAAALESRTAF